MTTANWLTRWASNIGSLITFFANDNVEFDYFTVTNRTYCLFGIIFDNSTLMDKHIFFSVVTVDETITAFNIEPFYGTGYLGSYKKKQILLKFVPWNDFLFVM